MAVILGGKAGTVEVSGQVNTVLIDPSNPARKAEMTPMGEQRVATHVRLVGTPFHGSGIDTNFWTATTSGTAAIVQLSGNAVMVTADTSGARAELQSVRVARYVAGVANYYRGVVMFDPGVSGNIRRWGTYNSSDGVFFEVNNTTFNVVLRKAGVDSRISSENFLSAPPSDSYFHTYEIYIKNRGVDFAIDDVQVYRHTISSEPMAVTFSLPATLLNQNNEGVLTSGTRLKAISSTINRMGEAMTRPIYSTFSGVAISKTFKTGPGTIHRILINNNGAAANILALYDGLTSGVGNLFAVIDTVSAPAPTNFELELDFFTGLTAVSYTGTGAWLTFIYE